MYAPQTPLKLASSISEQNVYFTYVCLVNEIIPNSFSDCQARAYGYLDADNAEVDPEEAPIQVERSKAVHELIETKNKDKYEEETVYDEEDPKAQTSCDEGERSDLDDFGELNGNPNILKLTKMKWLTEDKSPDSSSPSLSPNMSSTSVCSKESDSEQIEYSDKYLSTILRLDREHNMFGLSNLAIVGLQPTRRPRKEDDRPVFLQTAIVQVCCTKGCCRNMSKTDLPSSLKCGGCRSCCLAPICYRSCFPPCCVGPPCPNASCPPAPKCISDCKGKSFGMRVVVHRKPKYEQAPMELTPRSSCVLHKPFAARSCHHMPRCVPPSSVFPYLMPCFWPARPSAPCSAPTRCFHNPPCLAPRKRRPPNMPDDTCPTTIVSGQNLSRNAKILHLNVRTGHALEKARQLKKPWKLDTAEKNNLMADSKQNLLPGNSRENPFKKLNIAFVDKNKVKKKRNSKRRVECECSLPGCENCFVARPRVAEYLPYLTTPTVTQN